MFGNVLIKIHLTNGTEISYRKDLSYDDYWSLAASYEKSKEDELVVFQDSEDNEYLIPKKNILFILISE